MSDAWPLVRVNLARAPPGIEGVGIYLSMVRIRLLTMVALATAGVVVSPARGDGLPGLPPLCLPQIVFPLLPCPPAGGPPPGKTEPRPFVVTSATVRYDSRRIIVRFKRKTLRDAINAVFARANVKLEQNLTKVGLYAVKAPDGKRDEALASLRREKSVGLVEREILLDGLDTTPNDPAWPDQWGFRTAGFPKAWDVTRGSKNIVVAVLDTGVDKTHPELKGAIVPGRDIVNNDADPADDNGHGTAVAGLVAARGNNGIGIAGGCWFCLVMPVKVLGKDGTGTTTDVAAGIIWAADHGAKVINLSLGAPGTTAALSEAVDYAEKKDVVVVASAGNSSSRTPFYPAADGPVIGVAASNEADQLYSWSNRGSWVQVTAPGCNDAPWPGGGYVSFCGTSSAAPLVAGIAALVRSARPTATAIETVQAVDKAVDVVPAEVLNGRVNAAAAVAGQRASDAGKAQTGSATFRGRLGSRNRSRAFNRVVGTGQIVAVLRFSGARRLSLFLLRRDKAPVRVPGKSPLTLRQQVASGLVTFLVKGGGVKASYRLTLSYAVP